MRSGLLLLMSICTLLSGCKMADSDKESKILLSRMLKTAGYEMALPAPLDGLCRKAGPNEDRVIYLLNSECSVCIADFFAFSRVMSSVDHLIHLYCVVNIDSQYKLDYYTELFSDGKPLPNISFILADETYPFGMEGKQNVILALKNGNYRAFTYNNGRVL